MNLEQIFACRIDGCENRVENPDTMLCATHGHEMRRAERQSKQVKIVQPIRKVSKKMAKDLQDYGVLKRIHLKENPVCEAGLIVCDYVSVEVHHRAKRGNNLLDASTFMSVCRSCHDYIEFTMSAEERRERGFLITKEKTV